MILVGIFVVGLFAGFVDAIAGGGGLIMLPGLLFTGLPVGSAIATNKLCGTSGALTSTLKFAHAKQIDWRACGLMGIPAVLGAYLGSRSMGKLPNTWAEPIVIVLMVAITLFVLIKPSFGLSSADDSHTSPKSLSLKACLLGISAGFCIVLKGTGITKVIMLMTNCTSLVTFAALGNIDYGKGIAGAIGLGIGSFVGATFATKKGAKLIKPIFIAVTIALIAKLLFDYVSIQ